MVVRDVNIESYRWKMRIYYAVTAYHTDSILRDMQEIGCPEEIIRRVSEKMAEEDMDSGFTYSNNRDRRTVMVIGLWSSPAQFLNSLLHETRHLADDIASTDYVDPGGEDVAYLTGYLAQLLTPDVHRFICSCQCHK